MFQVRLERLVGSFSFVPNIERKRIGSRAAIASSASLAQGKERKRKERKGEESRGEMR